LFFISAGYDSITRLLPVPADVWRWPLSCFHILCLAVGMILCLVVTFWLLSTGPLSLVSSVGRSVPSITSLCHLEQVAALDTPTRTPVSF
jgi:hypothetical protein